MRIWIPLIVLVIGVSAFLVWWIGTPEKASVSNQSTLTIGETEVAIERADTPQQRAQGLSGRTGLRKGEGMLFVFEKPGIYRFWMKDMLFSIDIIWIDEWLRVVDTNENVDPVSYPETFQAREPIQYALEVPAGFAKTNNIHIGTQVSF